MMKLSTVVGVGVLSVLLGIPAAVYAQEEPKQEEPKAEPKAQEEPKPPKQGEQAKPPKQEQPNESKPSKNEEMKPSKQESPKHQSGQPAQQEGGHARAAGQSAHIPDDKFRSHFGRSHKIVINQPVVVEGQPRFQTGGYWFVISDPWPEGWAYTDDCYIDYVDGEYFLFDLLHPGVRIALVVVM